MSVQVSFIKCTACKCAVDMQVMGISSLLGPPEVQCHWCGGTVTTDRIEWWQMAGPAKVWFFGASILYMVLAWFLGGLSVNTALRLLDSGEWGEDWGLGEPAFWMGGCFWVMNVVLIQFYRVVASTNRNTAKEVPPLRRSLWSFQIGAQAKVLLLLLATPAVCWLVSLARQLF